MRYDEILKAREYIGLDRWRGQSFSGFTGTMAAALAANSTVAWLNYASGSGGRWLLQWMHLHFVCLAGFTTAVTAGRRLSLRRGNGSPSAPDGTNIDMVRDLSSAGETLLTGKIATTTGLTMTGVTYETESRARLLLAHCGNAGQDYDELWQFESPFFISTNETVGLVATQAFDAGGTWQLNIKGGGVEIES